MVKPKQPTSAARVRTDQPSWFERLSAPRRNLVCLAILYALVLFLFNKIVFNNMIFSDSGDTASALSWSVAGEHLKETEKIEPQWFPFVFSGMPAFGSLVYIPRNINYIQTAIQAVGKLFFLNVDMSWMVLHYLLGGVFMFLLCRYWSQRDGSPKFSSSAALVAAITFMLSPYAIGLAGGGHGSKLMALSYLPAVFLLTHTLFERRDILSLGLYSVALGTLFLTNHIQMVFYVLLLIGLYLLYEGVLDIRSQPSLALKKTFLLGLGLTVGFAICAYIYLSVREYAQYSIRGGGTPGTPGGLSYDYATNWSFHPFEIMNLLIPSFFGFRTPYYWGWMPFTESSVYVGILPVILGVLALIYRRNRVTVFLALATAIILLISFGKYFPILYDLMFNYFPYFNKFRTPSMILHLLPFIFGLMAAYGMTFLLEIHDKEKEINIAKLKKRILVVLIIIGGVLIIGFLAGNSLYTSLSGFMFQREGELQELRAQYGQQAGQVLEQLKKIRFDLLWSGREIQGVGYIWNGYVRFALFAGGGLGLILLYLNRKIKATLFSNAMVALLALDLLIIDANFIQPKPKTALKQQFQADETVKFLKSDTTLYRIYPVGGIFQDNLWMYHLISSVGGYSPAKLKIYQEMIDSVGLYPPRYPFNMNVLSMLNAKYVIVPGRLPGEEMPLVKVDQSKQLLTYENRGVLPRAFFVDTVVVSPSKTETFAIMNSPLWNPKSAAILEKEPAIPVMKPDSTSLKFTSFGAHRIVLEVFTSTPSLLVLSEIYYPEGWKAYIDEKETEIYKTNYILRSVAVPRGHHSVVFQYYSKTYHEGLTVSFMGWGMSFLLILAGVIQYLVRKRGPIRSKNIDPAARR